MTRCHFAYKTKIYAGFDTEFETEEARNVSLICYTLATYERCYFKYSPIKVDFTIDTLGKGSSSVPGIISSLTLFFIHTLRLLEGKPDILETHLLENLKKKVVSGDLECITLSDGSFLYSEPRDLPSLFKTFATKYSEDTLTYSFETLVNESLALSRPTLSKKFSYLRNLILECFDLAKFSTLNPLYDSFVSPDHDHDQDLDQDQDQDQEPLANHSLTPPTVLNPSRSRKCQKAEIIDDPVSVVKRIKSLTKGIRIKISRTDTIPLLLRISSSTDLTLISHYSAADIGTLTDFETYRSQMVLLKKTFVTLNRPMNILGCRVHLRDTALLSVGNSSGLSALGNLYVSQGLEKIEIDPQ